ncbi:hypothetical protein C8Q75DRAFT_730932 [Abortiporus biennis]|nr:hypothetical protein C8Q75DRAFT_730932 [Abortiporus biennis]
MHGRDWLLPCEAFCCETDAAPRIKLVAPPGWGRKIYGDFYAKNSTFLAPAVHFQVAVQQDPLKKSHLQISDLAYSGIWKLSAASLRRRRRISSQLPKDSSVTCDPLQPRRRLNAAADPQLESLTFCAFLPRGRATNHGSANPIHPRRRDSVRPSPGPQGASCGSRKKTPSGKKSAPGKKSPAQKNVNTKSL